MSKKKAKFSIEIEYENNIDSNAVDPRDVTVKSFDTSGDFKGIVLAFTSALAFTATKGSSEIDIFKQKVRLLRANASALVSIYATMRRGGMIPDGVASEQETEHILGEAVKRIVDYSCTGLANALELNPEQVKEVTNSKEYNPDNNEDNEQSGQGEQGDNPVDFDDYL